MQIYLFGSTGMIGGNIKSVLTLHYEVICIDRNDYDVLIDTDFKLKDLLKNIKNNDIIINCIGTIPQKYKIDNYRSYIKVNSLFPHKLQEIAERTNVKLIHITTDCVYNGYKGLYTENDIHDEDNLYGISKSLGEPENSCTIRTSIIGKETKNKTSLLEWIISNKNKKINGYINHLWNGITSLTLANIIKNMIENKIFWKGVRHIYSPNIVSKYDLCHYVNDIYNLNIEIVKYETCIINKTLNTSYNNLLKYNILDIKEQLKLQYIFNSTIHILGKNSFIGNSLYNNIQCMNKKIYSHTEINSLSTNLNNNDIIINCCGVNRGSDELLYNSNYLFIKELINIINLNNNIRLVNISSLIASELNNNSTFSRNKIMGDNYIVNNITNNNNYTVLRLCNILDNGIKPYNNNFIYTLIYEKQNNIINSTQYNVYNNNIYILSMEKVLDVVIDSIINPKNEILNVISDKKFNMHALIKLIHCNNETIKKYNINLINICNEIKYSKDINNIVKECNIEKIIYSITPLKI